MVDDTGSPAEADTAGDSEHPPSDPASPYGQNLVKVGGFEDPDLESWAVDGRCASTIGTGDLAPPEGEQFLRGMVGIKPMHHCRVSQVIDLEAAGFSAAAVDEGAVAVEAEAMLANRGPEGTCDDQVHLIVRHLASTEGPELGSIETRFAGTSDWSVFGATGLLPEGTRALQVAVEGRFRSPPDNDSYADDVQVWLREVTPEVPPITLAPLLQDTRTDAMVVAWETDGALGWLGVDYGRSGATLSERADAVKTMAIDDRHHVHVAELTGLEPGTAYDYRVDSGGTLSETFSFRTAPPPDASVRIAWLSDNQEGWKRFQTHLAHMDAKDPDLLIVPGDLVEDAASLDEWREWWWAPLVETADFGSTTPVMVARGNHDRHHPYGYACTQVPGNGVFYRFRYGPVFVVALGTQAPPAHVPELINQQDCLEAALASDEAQDAAFRIVTFHQSPFSNAMHNEAYGHAGARDNWVPLLAAYNVDMVISGHYHNYQRGELDGVTYVIIGGGGSKLLFGADSFWEHMTEIQHVWHYAMMDASQQTLTWTVRDIDDTIIDTIVLSNQ